jgi:hypothetical protein
MDYTLPLDQPEYFCCGFILAYYYQDIKTEEIERNRKNDFNEFSFIFIFWSQIISINCWQYMVSVIRYRDLGEQLYSYRIDANNNNCQIIQEMSRKATNLKPRPRKKEKSTALIYVSSHLEQTKSRRLRCIYNHKNQQQQ